MTSLKKNLSDFVICDTVHIPDDGYIGIPLEVTLLFDKKNGGIVPGIGGTPIILYVINANIERIGRDPDEDILREMLSRGHAVLLTDYLGDARACPPALDWSIQKMRRRVMNGDIDGIFSLPNIKHPETFIVPAGYDVAISKPYWAFDKHGADGILDKIVEIWNNDFRGTQAEKIIKWTDSYGNIKPLTTAHDGSSPVRLGSDGKECESGEYVRVKHALALDITDCVKPNGEPIDLNLYMHITYPRNPESPVPILCLSASAEHLASCAATDDRPQHNGALFRGYAAAIIDYGYTPMARNDHYGYFDGYPKKGYITGDNATYSLSFYNDKRIFTAGMRYLRYLALSEPEKYCFDTDAIGIFGNSKGAWMTFLGEKNPERFASKRMLKGHHDETAFDSGKTEPRGIIRGGEPQPWEFFGDLRIKSEADFIYSSCGGLHDSITEGHAPMFISCNRTDSSCYSTSNAMLAACRTHNVPCMWFDIPLPHTLAYGNDLLFNTDTYSAFFAFIGYYLKHDAPRALCARADISPASFTLRLRFSGGIPESEMRKVKVTDRAGNELCGKWHGELCGIDWSFTPKDVAPDTEYLLTVPKSIMADNRKTLQKEFTYSFTSPRFTRIPIPAQADERGGFCAEIPTTATKGSRYLEFISDSSSGFLIYSERGELLTRVYADSDGKYMLPSDRLSGLAGSKIIIKPVERGEITCYYENFSNSMGAFTTCKRAITKHGTAPDGRSALIIEGFEAITEHPSEEFYQYPAAAVTCDALIGSEPMTVADIGRRFRISLKIYDTSERYVNLSLSHVTSRENSITDHRRGMMNLVTVPGEWVEASLDYTVYEPIYTDIPAVLKSLTVSTYGSGNMSKPLYITDVCVKEYLSGGSAPRLTLVVDEDEISAFPEGKLGIVCDKSPWQK